ncbi:Virginiamycin B lyase [Streptomyces tendae]
MNEFNERHDTDSVREFTVGDADAGPYALTEGPDGALWFTLVHRGASAAGTRTAGGSPSIRSARGRP